MSTPKDNNEEQVNEVLLNLKFLGKIKPQTKIYLDPNQRLLSDSLTNSIIRSLFYSDSRDTTLSFVSTTIKKSLIILSKIYNSAKPSDISRVKAIKADLELATIGLENLTDTYKDDVKFECSLSLIKETIEGTIMDLDLPMPVKLDSVYDEDSDNESDDEFEDFEDKIIPVGNVPKKTFAEIAKSPVKKPEVKPIEVKPEVKPVAKKVEVKPVEVKKEVKPVVKPVVKPAVKKSLPVKIPVKKTKL
jgi:hypothetical protein